MTSDKAPADKPIEPEAAPAAETAPASAPAAPEETPPPPPPPPPAAAAASGEAPLASSFGDVQSMKKDEEVDLTAKDPSLRRVLIGAGWDAAAEKDGFPIDIDLCAFVLNRENVVRRDADFIFYNNLKLEGGMVEHKGDNPDGQGEGDDEVIHLSLEAVDFDVEKVAFSISIHNAEERQQTFGIVENAYIRVVNLDTGVELARFDLTEDASEDDAIIFGEIGREGVNWKFKALGLGSAGGLFKIAKEYGVNVAPV